MSIPDPADPEPNTGQESPHSHRRLWRWGIWFWMLLWTFSVLVVGGFKIELKGRPGIALGVAHGSVLVVRRDHEEAGKAFAITGIELNSVWSGYDCLYSQHPEFLFEWLGGVTWRIFRDRHMMAFPVSGILWLWLFVGWVALVSRKNQRLDFGGKRILVATLILLPLLILHASRTTGKVWTEREIRGCILNIQNIQQTVRSHNGMNNINPGAAIDMPWDEIFGPKKFLSLDEKK